MLQRAKLRPFFNVFRYRTFLEFEPDTHLQVEEILRELKNWCLEVNCLGIYPKHLTKIEIETQSFESLGICR